MFWYRNAFPAVIQGHSLGGHSELISQQPTEEHENWRVHNLLDLEIIGKQKILKLEIHADRTLRVHD